MRRYDPNDQLDKDDGWQKGKLDKDDGWQKDRVVVTLSIVTFSIGLDFLVQTRSTQAVDSRLAPARCTEGHVEK